MQKVLLGSFLFVGSALYGQVAPMSLQLETKNQTDSVPIVDYSHPLVSFVLRPADYYDNGMYLLTGKTVQIINPSIAQTNLSEKVGRQLFAQVPSAFIYDMDGSGNQINVAVRGLDPHRGWEFNIRQNGIMTNSDIYGYPASHYSPPMEAIERVEMVGGAASIQYGTGFGGMLNYVTKSPDTTRRLSYESITTAGSYGLLSTYQRIHGRIGKFSYSAYYQKRVSDGYRRNSESKSDAQFVQISYQASEKVRIKAELGRSTYLYHTPGQLTDSMFYADPRSSTRSRNYFSPTIYVPSIVLDWAVSDKTKVEFSTAALLGTRNSVLFDAFANVVDTINPLTMQYKNRQVDIDNFNSYNSEARIRHVYSIGRNHYNILVAGVRYTYNDLHRRQQGKGTTGTDYDLSLVSDVWGRDLHFRTQNIAAFIENKFTINKKFTVSPAVRVESGVSELTGNIVYLPTNEVERVIKHQFALGGVAAQYSFSDFMHLYANVAQAYRPVALKDIIPSSVLERSAQNLKDELGYNAEVGIHYWYKDKFQLRASLFQVYMQNRMGNVVLTDSAGSSYILRTNIGNSLTRGIELAAHYDLIQEDNMTLRVRTATSYMDAYYIKASIANGSTNTDISGNRVESVPAWITRNSVQWTFFKFNFNVLYSYVSKTYSDALNTETPSANGAKGVVPSYGIWDATASYQFSEKITVSANANNIFNKQYFTKRPAMYPGAGVWSSDGRSVQISLHVRL